MNIVYLTRRNLLTLLSKLDRHAKGDATQRTLLKLDTVHPKYPCSHQTALIAVEDEDYYTYRLPGEVHPNDNPKGEVN